MPLIIEIVIGILLLNFGILIGRKMKKKVIEGISAEGEFWLTTVFKDNRDLDSTLSIFANYVLFFMVIIGLFVLDFYLRMNQREGVLTEALIHTIIGFIAGWISNSNSSFFRKMGEMVNPKRQNQQK